MEAESEIVLETVPAEHEELAEVHARALPYSFAKRHGILIRDVDDTHADTVCRTGVTPLSLAEARRFAGVPLTLSRVSAEDFDTALQEFYERDRTRASQMVDGLDAGRAGTPGTVGPARKRRRCAYYSLHQRGSDRGNQGECVGCAHRAL